MKEMGNNDFIHTLDAVYNLCFRNQGTGKY